MKRSLLLVMGVLVGFGGLGARQSLEALERKVAASPANTRALYELTRQYCKEDSASRAIESWRRLVELDADLASDVYLRAKVAVYLEIEPFFPEPISDSMAMSLRLSPDGRWVVFQAVIEGRMQIARMSFFGNNYEVITKQDYYHHSPSFAGSPDELVYVRRLDRSGEELVYTDVSQGETNVVLSNFLSPIESPNRSLAKLPLLFSYLSPDSKTREIGLYDMKTGEFKELTRNTYTDRSPRYSSRGNLIVYENDRQLNADLYIMNRRGKIKERLTHSTAEDVQSDFGDRDRKIAFVSNRHRSEHFDIFVYDRRTKDVMPITFTEAMDLRPDLSDDGNWLIFDSNRAGGRAQAYVVSLNQPISVEQLVEEIDKENN